MTFQNGQKVTISLTDYVKKHPNASLDGTVLRSCPGESKDEIVYAVSVEHWFRGESLKAEAGGGTEDDLNMYCSEWQKLSNAAQRAYENPNSSEASIEFCKQILKSGPKLGLIVPVE